MDVRYLLAMGLACLIMAGAVAAQGPGRGGPPPGVGGPPPGVGPGAQAPGRPAGAGQTRGPSVPQAGAADSAFGYETSARAKALRDNPQARQTFGQETSARAKAWAAQRRAAGGAGNQVASEIEVEEVEIEEVEVEVETDD